MNESTGFFLFLIIVIIGITIGAFLDSSSQNYRLEEENRHLERMAEIQSKTEDPVQLYSNIEIINAIGMVEVGTCQQDSNLIGDDGASFGPLQISEAYHQDADNNVLYKECNKWDNSVIVFYDYMQRYLSRDMYIRLINNKCTIEDVEVIARIHNGGPTGYTKDSTLKYWAKIKEQL